MAIPASLKFDVRVRERLVGDGLLTESEVQKHLEGLVDLDSQAVELTIKQPALQNESDRDIVIIRTSGVRPPIAPVRPADEDLPIIDDDDDDDDDDLDVKKPEVKKPVEKPVEKPRVKSDDEDADDDEEKDDDEKDDDEKDGEEKPEIKEGEVDKDWGAEP